jgi:excinuclease ABC subunit B
MYIAKDARINELLDQLRHAAIQSVLTRKDFIIVSSVSCIYGIGDPEEYKNICLNLKKGDNVSKKEIIEYLKNLQYEKNHSLTEIKAGSYFNDENKIFIISPDASYALEIVLEKNKVTEIRRYPIRKIKDEKISIQIDFNFENLEEIKIFPAKFFITSREKLKLAILNIRKELRERYWQLLKEGKIVEAERLKRRTLLDLALLEKNGYCPGIENYSRHLSFRNPGEPPYTLLDYLPPETIIFIDESHLSIPQLRAMYNGDRRRKEVLVEYGWRLPSALDNRPLKFDEFFAKDFQIIFVSATPGKFERKISSQIVEQLIRPTGIPDPEILVKPTKNQVLDLIEEIKKRLEKKQRVLVLTLTKRSAENLTEFLLEQGIKAHYLHSDIKTLKRAEIIKKLRLGEIEVLVGINLLREGLDLPEVSLVAILDADKEGFLRNSTTLIQAMGRAARHLEGKVILYADKITKSMEEAIRETERRRKYQLEFNKKHKIIPKPIIKEIHMTPEEILGKVSYEEEITKEELELFIKIEKDNL